MVKSEGSHNSLPHFSIWEKFSQIVHLLGIVINGASWQQLLRNLDPITGTRMYNQVLKIINEPREKKKMLEEKDSLKESVVNKKKKKNRKRKVSFLELKTIKGRNVSSSRPKKVVLSSRPKKEEKATSQFRDQKMVLSLRPKKNFLSSRPNRIVLSSRTKNMNVLSSM